MGHIITCEPMIIMDTEFGCLMGCTRLESNLAANSRVLIGTSSINHGFSSMPCLITGGYPLKERIFHSTLSGKPEGKS